jgi:type II secretory pathway pseudopilin PulG
VKKRKGMALGEVIVAISITAMISVAVFSVILSVSSSGVKIDKKEAATSSFVRLQETLKSYVTVETGGFFNAPGAKRPGTAPDWWHLAGDTNPGWALTAGAHTVTAWLPPAISAGGSLRYQVTNLDCGLGLADNLACKQVQITLTYAD